MSRLIDADLLIDVIKNIQDHMREVNKNPVPVDAREIFTLFIEMVEKQSTAYDPEEVVELLEGASYFSEYLDAKTRYINLYKAIKIVREGGVK